MWQTLNVDGYEYVAKLKNQNGHTQAILAIHSLKQGPALGGCRFQTYKDADHALREVLYLAKAMSFKNALAELPFGGGKIVLIENNIDSKPAVLSETAEFLNELNGAYIAGPDIGTNELDMDELRKHSEHVVCYTGFIKEAPLSSLTALGVYSAIKAALFFLTDNTEIKNKQIWIQGLGKTGYSLLTRCLHDGALPTISEKTPTLLEQVKRQFSVPEINQNQISQYHFDVFSPCGESGTITSEFINLINTSIICGSANAPLLEDNLIYPLHEKGIVFLPDYLVNAGGVIGIASTLENNDFSTTQQKVERIYERTLAILTEAQALNLPPAELTGQIVRKVFG